MSTPYRQMAPLRKRPKPMRLFVEQCGCPKCGHDSRHGFNYEPARGWWWLFWHRPDRMWRKCRECEAEWYEMPLDQVSE